MFNTNSNGYSLADIAAATGNDRNGNGMFGNDSWIGLIIILALLSGNFGGFGGFGGGNGGVANEVQRGFDNQSVLNKLNGLENGLCDGFYSQNTTMLQGFNGLQQTVANGFHGVDNAICTLGYQNQQGFNTLAHQISDCCCETQRSIDGVNYNMATQACETRHAIQDSTRQILDFLTTDKIATLQAENQNLKLKASQAEQNAYITANQQAQTAELIRRLGADCPVNAYVVQPPTPVTFPTNCCGQFSGYGYNNGCGCA
jgi:hypothetical protein